MDMAGDVVYRDVATAFAASVAILRAVREALTWRRIGTVLVLCLIFSTQVLAQPDLLERWSLDRVFEGWAFYFVEIALPGFAMFAAVSLAAAIAREGSRTWGLVIAVALPVGAALGYVAAVTILYSPGFPIFSWQFVGDTLRFTALGAAVVLIHVMRRRSEAASAAAHETEVAREALARQTAEARLQLMEAQIEPHFLFNSLANVQRLYETDPEAGQHLLDNLKIYLAGALAQMRDARPTVGHEVDLAGAYLEVLRARMGERLKFKLEVPQDLRDRPFPPMMLITLVENAVKHGIHRSPTGGSIAVRARRDGERLCVEVADTGAGFQSHSGKGIGLANIRARLHALFGDRAHLSLGANAPSGVVASIMVPIP
jgi:signal transduction histidine kinase